MFFFNDTATTEIYTLSLHDALPISHHRPQLARLRADAGRGRGDTRVLPAGAGAELPALPVGCGRAEPVGARTVTTDRKSTRLNSSHANISYAVFCLKKKHKSM